MKKRCRIVPLTLLAAAAFLGPCACGDPADARYALVMPELPSHWTALLGNPRWRIDYFDARGVWDRFETGGDGVGEAEVSLLPYTASAVAAWPFWPDRGIHPGVFRPAGALYPFDISGGSLTLSWRGGVEAFFYRELAASAGRAAPSASALRQPQNFDWPRFREILSDPAADEAVRTDPWIADWRSIAEKTVRSGFNRRRIVPAETGLIPVPAGEGPWFGVSPFAAPWRAGPEEPPLFPVGTETASFFSPAGTLRLNRDAWMLLPWP
ncbi:MAG: hypothetical protein LBS06_06375 [Treponema sp.]|jgi:hypothetical protein|nr:hypothetical protein [Treponema sp.]